MKRTRSVIGLAALSILLAACGAASASSNEDSAETSAHTEDVHVYELPEDYDYQQAQSEASVLHVAMQPRISQCMTAQGFAWVPGERNEAGVTSEELDRFEVALFGTERFEFSGPDGMRGSTPADGCIAQAAVMVAGSLEAAADIDIAATTNWSAIVR